MTEITLQEAFKSKVKFQELMENTPVSITQELANYPALNGKTIIHVAELTQNIETLFNILGDDMIQNLKEPPFIVWIITNEKGKIMNFAKIINQNSKNGFGIFIFKASLINDKIDIKCLLKPELKTSSKQLSKFNFIQMEYWEKYFQICDEIGSDMQVNPKCQHWQYLPMGKRGVCLMLTISTKLKYIGVDLVINYDKEIYNKLEEYSDELNKEFDGLEWVNLPDNKSAKIRKTLNYDITDSAIVKDAIKTHIELAEKFKKVFSKYL